MVGDRAAGYFRAISTVEYPILQTYMRHL